MGLHTPLTVAGLLTALGSRHRFWVAGHWPFRPSLPVRSRPSPDSPGCGRGRQRHRRLGPVPFPCLSPATTSASPPLFPPRRVPRHIKPTRVGPPTSRAVNAQLLLGGHYQAQGGGGRRDTCIMQWKSIDLSRVTGMGSVHPEPACAGSGGGVAGEVRPSPFSTARGALWPPRQDGTERFRDFQTGDRPLQGRKALPVTAVSHVAAACSGPAQFPPRPPPSRPP